MGIGANELTSLIVVAAVAFLFFLLVREFWCWYFKINAGLELLREISDQLNNLPKERPAIDKH